MKKDTTPKIAVVDDSEFTRHSMVNILTEEGFQVVGQAASAEDAVKLLSSADANIFIIDVVMPQVSGLELAKLLIEQNSQLKIVMISSLKTEGIVIESISSGAIDFIQKPFTREELVISIKNIERALKEDK